MGEVARVVGLYGIYMRPFIRALVDTLLEFWLNKGEVR
jgi:hypothetical protein